MTSLLFSAGLILVTLAFPGTVSARENVTDWYIQDFRAEFVVHEDSTMTVTEWITADCGNLPDKHGIFRVLPTVAQTPDGEIVHPVDLISITDFSGKSYMFEVTKNTGDDTVTWKIGDPNQTVTGVNEYKIVYRVKNVIRDQGSFHEWYWNVVGNFWEIPIDSFQATIQFPEGVKGESTALNVYSGGLGNKSNPVALARWVTPNTLLAKATRGLFPKEGITLSVSFPTDLFVLYQFTWWERFGAYFWFLLPLTTLVLLYRIWRKYGDDPDWNKPTIPEYEIPEGLNALTAGVLIKNGRLATNHITAALIELAVKGAISIQKVTSKKLFFQDDEFYLSRHHPTAFHPSPEQILFLDLLFASADPMKLTQLRLKSHPVLASVINKTVQTLIEKKSVVIMDEAKDSSDTVKLSQLKQYFHTAIPEIQEQVRSVLIKKGLFTSKGFLFQGYFGVAFFSSIFIIFGFGTLFTFIDFHWPVYAAIGITWLLILLFAIIMPKRTLSGVETYAKLKGLKRYMETAEQYRQRFYEKEGIFDTLLPMAILFGMTKEWIKKMEMIYGPDYFTTHHPAWFIGSFDSGWSVESFTDAMESVSKSIATNMGTSSGASGGGSSGGGGGGGGGGGW